MPGSAVDGAEHAVVALAVPADVPQVPGVVSEMLILYNVPAVNPLNVYGLLTVVGAPPFTLIV